MSCRRLAVDRRPKGLSFVKPKQSRIVEGQPWHSQRVRGVQSVRVACAVRTVSTALPGPSPAPHSVPLPSAPFARCVSWTSVFDSPGGGGTGGTAAGPGSPLNSPRDPPRRRKAGNNEVSLALHVQAHHLDQYPLPGAPMPWCARPLRPPFLQLPATSVHEQDLALGLRWPRRAGHPPTQAQPLQSTITWHVAWQLTFTTPCLYVGMYEGFLIKAACVCRWYFRVYAMVWVLGGTCLHCCPQTVEKNSFGESGTVVPLVTGAASAPWCPSRSWRWRTSHKVFPKTVKFGGWSPPQMRWGKGQGGRITVRDTSVAGSDSRHCAF